MKPILLLLVFALLMTACQPAADGTPTPMPEIPTRTSAPTETPPTSQADIATLTAALQSQLDETCQTDPLLCQAYKAYKNSRQTDPLHSLALGLLKTSTDNPPFTLAIDPINGEPVVYLDSAESSGVALLRPAIGGDEGHLFISTSPYGENARISHEGPGLANAYDEDGALLGCVSAKTGQWVDASELTQADRKEMIAFAGQMELLAQQVVEGKIAIKDLQFTPEQRAVFDEMLVQKEAALPFEARLELLKAKFDATKPNIMPAIEATDGRLAYYDGKQVQYLEPMFAPGGKQMTWGEGYMTGTPEGDGGIESTLNQSIADHISSFLRGQRNLAEAAGIKDTSEMNAMLVQFIPDNSTVKKTEIGDISLYEVTGKSIIKLDDQVFVVKKKVFFQGRIDIVHADIDKKINYSSGDLFLFKSFKIGLIGIPNEPMLTFVWRNQLNKNFPSNSNEGKFLQETMLSGAENISSNLDSDWRAVIWIYLSE